MVAKSIWFGRGRKFKMTNTKKYYAWAGQNASCGTPNITTGRMNMYGDNYVFSCKKEREEFVENYRSDNPSEFCVSCSKAELRSYNLGLSVRDFEFQLAWDEQRTIEMNSD